MCMRRVHILYKQYNTFNDIEKIKPFVQVDVPVTSDDVNNNHENIWRDIFGR